MKNLKTDKFYKLAMFLFAIAGMLAFHACSSDDDPEPESPVASFQYEISDENFMEVIFQNFSQNATSYSWDFGDGENSTEDNPTHVYAEPGVYDVSLTASNDAGESHTFTETIGIDDPDEALTLLAGLDHKEWKLYRVGTSLGVGEDKEHARAWWALENDGSRPCKYFHTFTFHRNGDFVFDDQGAFWGEDVIFAGTDVHGTCFEAIPANMINKDGVDVSAFLSGTHAFEYDPTTNMVTLDGYGAWMGMPQMTTTEESSVPVDSKRFKIESIEERGEYDLMIISYTYDGLYWDFSYAHYHDPAAEPEVVEEEDEIDDLPPYTPAAFFNTFASEGEDDVQYLFPTPDESDVTITIGVDDPADPEGAKVGQYHRGTTLHADLKFMMDFNIQFDNFSTVSIDVYVPSDNDYSGELNQSIQIWIADMHTTQNFWDSWVHFVVPADEVVEDEWVTYTFDLDDPSEGSAGNPLERTDLDAVGLTIGGSNHNDDAIFYIRNFIFE